MTIRGLLIVTLVFFVWALVWSLGPIGYVTIGVGYVTYLLVWWFMPRHPHDS